jgi:hypothetical protein
MSMLAITKKKFDDKYIVKLLTESSKEPAFALRTI